MRFIRFIIPCLAFILTVLFTWGLFTLGHASCRDFQASSVAPKVPRYKLTTDKTSCRLLDTYKSKYVRIDYTVGCFEGYTKLRHLVVLYRKSYGKIAMNRLLKYTRDLKEHRVIQMVRKHQVAKPDGYTYVLILYRVLK